MVVAKNAVQLPKRADHVDASAGSSTGNWKRSVVSGHKSTLIAYRAPGRAVIYLACASSVTLADIETCGLSAALGNAAPRLWNSLDER
jgi:hypothetical protein